MGLKITVTLKKKKKSRLRWVCVCGGGGGMPGWNGVVRHEILSLETNYLC